MRYESRLAEMAKILGFLKMETGSAAAPTFHRNRDYGLKETERLAEKYRRKRKVRNKMARESRRRNRT